MKANEAPEKLYIALTELTEDGRTFVLDHRVNYPTCTEYIRTDVFIERAEEFIYTALNDGIMGTANIEDFMRLFKKYMEGE